MCCSVHFNHKNVEGGNGYGEGDHDTGYNVKKKKKSLGGRVVPDFSSGRLPGSALQISEYGVEFFYYRRRPGNGPGSGDAG